MDAEFDWEGPRSMRIATIVSFIPAFPLCLAHGIISSAVVPAVGLVPLFFSAAFGSYLCMSKTGFTGPKRAWIVFGADLVLATSLMVVLVITWVSIGDYWWYGGVEKTMLAAYSTMPLLANFFIHTYLCLRSVYVGLALDSLVQWAAWQVVPAECPNCNHHLRPPFPRLPWLQGRRSEGDSIARLFVRQDDPEEGRYHDMMEDGEGSGPVTVNVVGKGKKARSSLDPEDEEAMI